MMNVLGRSLEILAGATVKQAKDYVSNINDLVTDANEIKGTITGGVKTVADKVREMRSRNGSLIKTGLNWFYQRSSEYSQYDLGDDMNDDFDPGFNNENPEESEDSPQVIDSKSMKNIARGQVAAMYQIGGKQVEASLANTAEIITTFNNRSCEIISSINNLNKSLLGISDRLNKIAAVIIEPEKEKDERRRKNSILRNGRVTLGTLFNSSVDAVKDNPYLGMAKMLFSFGQMGAGPEDFAQMLLSSLVFDKVKIGGKSINQWGEGFNKAIGNWTSDIFSHILESEIVKKYIGDFTKRRPEDYKDYYEESDYNREKAVFDGMTRKSIVDVIPNYLKEITQSLTGLRYEVDSKGNLTTKKIDMYVETNKRYVGQNLLSYDTRDAIKEKIKDSALETQIDSRVLQELEKLISFGYTWVMYSHGEAVFSIDKAQQYKPEVINIVKQEWTRRRGSGGSSIDIATIDTAIDIILSEVFIDSGGSKVRSGDFVASLQKNLDEMHNKNIELGRSKFGNQAHVHTLSSLEQAFDAYNNPNDVLSQLDTSRLSEVQKSMILGALSETAKTIRDSDRTLLRGIRDPGKIRGELGEHTDSSTGEKRKETYDEAFKRVIHSLDSLNGSYSNILEEHFEDMVKRHLRSNDDDESTVTRSHLEEGTSIGSLVTNIWKKLNEGVIKVTIVRPEATISGNYPPMNMSRRGCGPTALADLFNRENGLDPESLAERMYGSGSYDPNAGTTVDGYIKTADKLGMKLHPGKVTQESVGSAKTLLGSGYGFGTHQGNLHFMNILGSDGSSVFTSNPMYGGIHKYPSGLIAGNSILGLYGSGDEVDEKTESLVKSLEDAIDGKTEDLKSKLKDPNNQSLLIKILREGGINEEDISEVSELIKRGGFEKALGLPGILGITRKISATAQAIREHASNAGEKLETSLNEEIGSVKDDVRTAFKNSSDYRHQRREDIKRGKEFAESRKGIIEAAVDPRDREYANEALQMMQAALADGDGKKDLTQIIRVVNRIQDKDLRQDLSTNISRLIRNSAEKNSTPAKSKLGKILFWGWGLLKKVLSPVKTAIMAVGSFFLRNGKSLLKLMARPFVQSAGWIASGVKDVKEGLFGRKEEINGEKVKVENGLVGATAEVVKNIFKKISNDPAVKAAVEVFNSARKMFGVAGKWIKTMPKVIFGAIKGTVKITADYLIEHGNTILHFLIFNPLTFIGNAFKHVIFEPLGKGIKKLGKGISNVAKFIGNSFKHVIFDTAKNGIDKLKERIKGDEKKQLIRDAQRKRREAKKEHLENIKKAAKREKQEEKERKREERLDRIRNKQDTIGDRLGYIFDTLGTKIKELTTGLFNDIKKYGGDIFKGLGKVAKNLPGFLGRAVTGTVGGVARGTVDMTKGFFGGIRKSHAAGKDMANSFLKSALGYDKKAADMQASTLADQKAREIMEFIKDPNSILNKNISDILRELILVREGDETARKEAKENELKQQEEAKRSEESEKIEKSNGKDFTGKAQEKVGKDQSNIGESSPYSMFSDSMRSNNERDMSMSNSSENETKSETNTKETNQQRQGGESGEEKPTSAAGKLGSVLGKSLNGMFKIVAGIGTMLASAVMEMKIVSTIGKTISRMIKSIVAPLAKTISKLWTAIKPVLKVVKDCLRNIVSQVGELIEEMVVTLQPVFDIIGELLPSIVQLLSDILIPLIQWITEKALAVLVPLIEKVIAPGLKIVIGIIGYISSSITGLIKWLGQNLLSPILRFFDDWKLKFGGLDKEKYAERQEAIDKLSHVYDTWKENDTTKSYYGNMVKSGFNELGRGTQTEKDTIIDVDAVDVNDRFRNESSGGSVMEGNLVPSVVNNNNDNSSSSTVTNEAGSGDTTNIYNTYGSGMGSQSSYGTDMNMRDHGCGPVALADRYARTTGNRITPVALARSMNASGDYDSNRGTRVGSFVSMGRSMGMNMTVGGVNDRSLRQASPNNPITVVGSGGAFGTRQGNTHYMNVVGSDGSGHAYVANPMRGGISKVSISDITSHSIAGLYGSGDDDATNDWHGGSGIVDFENDYERKYQEWASQYKKQSESEESARERFNTIVEAEKKNAENEKKWEESGQNIAHDLVWGNIFKKKEAYDALLSGGTYDTERGLISTETINAIVGDDDYTLATGRSASYNAAKSSSSLAGGMQSKDEISSTDPTTLSSVYGFSDTVTELMDSLKTLAENFLSIFTGQTGADAAMSKQNAALERSAILDGLTEEQRESLESDAYELWKSENEKLSTETDLQYEQRWKRDREAYIMRVAETNLGINAQLEGISRENLKTAATEYSDAMKTVMDNSGYIDNLYQYRDLGGYNTNAAYGGTSSGYDKEDLIRNVAEVFEAYGNINSNGDYHHGLSGIITTRSGISRKIRPDCSGIISAGIQNMGYTIKGAGESGVDSHTFANATSNTLILDEATGEPSSDWVVMPFTASDLQRGDITAKPGHVSLPVVNVESPHPKGLDAGGDSNIRESIAASVAYLNGTEPIPWRSAMGSSGEGWGGPATKIWRFVGNPMSGMANQGRLNMTKLMSDYNWFEPRKNDPRWENYHAQAVSAGVSPAQEAYIAGVGIIEDGAKKLLCDADGKPEKSLTHITHDCNGQAAFGISNWIPKHPQGGEDYTYGSRVGEQIRLGFVPTYFGTNPSAPRAKVTDNLSSYSSALQQVIGYAPKLGVGQLWGEYLNEDLLEGTGHGVGNAVVPGDQWKEPVGHAKYIGSAAGYYNWLFDKGYITLANIDGRKEIIDSQSNKRLIQGSTGTAAGDNEKQKAQDKMINDADGTPDSYWVTSNSTGAFYYALNKSGDFLFNAWKTKGQNSHAIAAFEKAHDDEIYGENGKDGDSFYAFDFETTPSSLKAKEILQKKYISMSNTVGSGDSSSMYIPPINDSTMTDYFNGTMFDTTPQTTNNYYISRDEGDAVRDHLTDLLNRTFEVRSESIESILTEMLNEMKKEKKAPETKQTTRTNSMFDNDRIPHQIERLMIGKA